MGAPFPPLVLPQNYNWFNLHTLVLLLPAWADDVILLDATGLVVTRIMNREAELPLDRPQTWAQRLLAPALAWERLFKSALGSTLAIIAALAFICTSTAALFPIRLDWGVLGGDRPDQQMMPFWITPLDRAARLLTTNGGLHIENRADEAFVRWMLDVALRPHVIGGFLYTVTAFAAVGYAVGGEVIATPPVNREQTASSLCRRAARRLGSTVAFAWRVAVGFASLLLLGVTLLPLESIAQRPVYDLIPATAGLRASTLSLHARLAPLHVSNSYGLFRRMTGVGPRLVAGVPEKRGWGGLPPMVVQVPVVVLEGHPLAESGESGDGWVEIPFRYVPGATDRAPRRTAPHQPRVDWQMWFAALGSYQHNPWLLHLVYKILLGRSHSASIELLDLDAYPFAPGAPPKRVRATLYHYDFTRVSSEWARRTPGVSMQPANCSILGPYAHGLQDMWSSLLSSLPFASASSSALGSKCSHWWKRSRVREYLPPVDRQLLEEQIVKRQGWPIGGAKLAADPCATTRGGGHKRSKADEDAITLPQPVCAAVVALRHRVGAALRRFVGWRIGTEQSSAFVDGPLVVISGLGFCASMDVIHTLTSLCDALGSLHCDEAPPCYFRSCVCVVTVWKWMQCGGLGYSDQCFYAGADEIILNSGEGIQ
jgi:hypothetical protein